MKGALKGIYGYPVSFLWAGHYSLSDAVTLKSKIDVKQNIIFSTSWIHAYNRNLRIVFSDTADLTNLLTEPSKTNYNFGALLEWTL